MTWDATPANPFIALGGGGVALAPAAALTAPAYNVTATAVPRGPRRNASAVTLRATARTVVNAPPTPPPRQPPLAVAAATLPAVAWATRLRLSTPLHDWAPALPSGRPLEARFVFSAGGTEWDFPDAPGFRAAPNATVWAPWLPTSGAPGLPTACGVYVRDAHGATAGPFRAPIDVQGPPSGPSPYPVDVVALPCLTVPCPDAPLPQALQRAQSLAAGCPAPPASDLRTALRLTARMAAHTPPHALPPFPARMANASALVAAFAACPSPIPTALLEPLLQAIDAVAYAGGPPDAPNLPALIRVLDAVQAQARAARRPDCAFSAASLRTPHIAFNVSRAPPHALPRALEAGSAAVHLPAAVLQRLSDNATGAIDAEMWVLQGPPLLASQILSLTLVDAATGASIAPAALPEPITLGLPTDAAPSASPAAAPRYQCLDVADGRMLADPDVRLLGPGPLRGLFHCSAPRLGALAVLALPQLHAVSGCHRDVPPSALYCPLAATLALTLTGWHFGRAGAAVALHPAGGGGPLRCDRVAHVPGAEDTRLVCHGLQPLPTEPLQTWMAVTVTRADSRNASLAHAALVTGPPAPARLEPWGAGCTAAGRTALVHCPPGGSGFRVRGAHLAGPWPTRVWAGPYACPEVTVESHTAVACAGLQGVGQGHVVVVAVGGLQSARDPPLVLSFHDGDGCAPGRYGPQCAGVCPGTDLTLPLPRPCSAHGVCDDGATGTGACACFASPEDGYFAGSACERCAPGYWGAGCRTLCPGADGSGLALRVCSGHGACDEGPQGSGACACAVAYAGPDCSRECPVAFREGRPMVCAGRGVCAPSNGSAAVCGCDGDAVAGYWTGVACTACLAPYVGPNCTWLCPTAASGVPCAGHGRCKAGPSAALCACDRGYGGPACAAQCPGPGADPCSGHGRCDVHGGVAECVCVTDSDQGHWNGTDCGQCRRGWAGPQCTVACPSQGPAGAVCGGRGACQRDARCACDAGRCGDACEFAGADCSALCPEGTYGPGCSRMCACGAHGRCLHWPTQHAPCLCDAGYAGPNCSVVCPGGPLLPCGGHGLCLRATGACACDAGWGTPQGLLECTARCPSATPAALCSGHGWCSSVAQCVCDAGYGGADCTARCPVADGVVCGGHGRCQDGRCRCDAGPATGRWAGEACRECAIGAYGAGCTAVCAHGTTQGQACVCRPGWFGTGCLRECPNGASLPCAGHGTCDDGAQGTGACLCSDGFAGVACTLRCPGDLLQPCSGHGQCNPISGTCECQDDAWGHWTGAACDACRPPYFGAECNSRCPSTASGGLCAGHGTCVAGGACRCEQSPAGGYWAGGDCARCSPGYYGGECRLECPGGACSPCSGHGRCSEGRNGTGECTCVSEAAVGFFTGVACAECRPGYFSASCDLPCPGGSLTPCNSHGVCSDGVLGNGMCQCHGDPQRGFWAGVGCDRCRPSHWGVQCTRPCPSAAGQVCAGHGVCFHGPYGNGTCACGWGFIGPECATACPAAAGGAVCGGHGLCLANASSSAACVCDADPASGYWTGEACDACGVSYAGPDCRLLCPDCHGHGECSAGRNGTGQCECVPGWGGAQCSAECPGGAALPCGGHGVCAGDATCVCSHSPERGYFAGPACGACSPGYAGDDCRSRCAVGPGGQLCSGRGRCHQDTCLCNAGFCGMACEIAGAECRLQACAVGRQGADCQDVCPGLNVSGQSVCSGHGLCWNQSTVSTKCLCDAGWSGEDCGTPCLGVPPCTGRGVCNHRTAGCQCLDGFGGADCSELCSGGWSSPCLGHGVCRTAPGGAVYCACAEGYGGASCEHRCPTGPGNALCAGHGTCVTDGRCACAPQWSGPACAACAPGWYGADCAQPCVQGLTEGGACHCHSGWAGPGCTIECTGGWADPCSGHGVCNGTAAGDGRCTCAPGWVGAACALPCPTAAGAVCGGHGLCMDSGLCSCTADQGVGYWGTACEAACPMGGNGRFCSGHGQCDSPTTRQCSCQPQWTQESNCTECEEGYYGSDCQGECPGVSGLLQGCQLCSGHGVCDSGRGGSGLCGCDLRWAGSACDACAPGHYAPDCTGQCPGLNGGPVCSGHGACDDGVGGSGQCTCLSTPGQGIWTGPACGQCGPGYYGAACALQCPGGAGHACSGHGACDDGTAGAGSCACAAGYGGPACEFACPFSRGLACGGFGLCDTGPNGTFACDCGAAPVGQWTGAACEACADGWVGPLCTLRCPVTDNAAVCGGQGVCVARNATPTAPAEAVCQCATGYAGPTCRLRCPGPPLDPCYGHGTCDPGTGLCACDRSAALGHWAQPDCLRCEVGWSGFQCTLPCPVGLGGLPCSGGLCAAGACVECPTGRCGPACNQTGLQCEALVCTVGYWGPTCQHPCPAGPGGVCAGHGQCLNTVYSEGLCACDPGYTGANCSFACNCTGHGTCDPSDGSCVCFEGYASANCSRACPEWEGRVCGGHGLCDDGAQGPGTCTCDEGFLGSACSLVCPRTAPGTMACAGHGHCYVHPLGHTACQCASDAQQGHWAGEACQDCAAGWHGPACLRVCHNGVTAGRACVCHPGYAGPDCAIQCPGPPAQRCGGHGRCDDGAAGTGQCVCDPDWYGRACGAYCHPSLCNADVVAPAPHPACDAEGRCTCQSNSTGRWAGPDCNVCEPGWWGLPCNKACSCNGHGLCGRLDGICQCYNSREEGHWTGLRCDRCQEQYLAPLCKAVNVQITRRLEFRATVEPVVDPTPPSLLLVDEVWFPGAGRVCGGCLWMTAAKATAVGWPTTASSWPTTAVV